MREKGGISWPNFTKLFICINELSRLLEYYLAVGSYEEAKEFIGEYGSFNVFKRFSSQLTKISK